jgi:uncharacterized protein YdeI (YjbR/CyaY-like superfamily)
MLMPANDDLPVVSFDSRQDFESWLEAQHGHSKGIWLKIAKKGSGVSTVTYDEALDSALCYGWIDGQKGTFDDQYWLQRFTPRGARSKWSQVNCKRAEELLQLGVMRPAGVAEVERAKGDGRWAAAYASQKTAVPPPDLVAALTADPEAEAFFQTLDSRNRYAILYRIGDAKKPETRAARIAKYVEMCREHKLLYP